MAEGASVALQTWRLCRPARLHRPRQDDDRRTPDHAARSAREATCRNLRRVRPAFPALHRAGLQGRADSGVYLQITADDARDLPVPGQKASFGVIKAAQARGDFDVLTE